MFVLYLKRITSTGFTELLQNRPPKSKAILSDVATRYVQRNYSKSDRNIMKQLRGTRSEIHPILNRNTVSSLVFIDQVPSLIDIHLEKIMAGSLSKSLICKRTRNFHQLRSVSQRKFSWQVTDWVTWMNYFPLCFGGIFCS